MEHLVCSCAKRDIHSSFRCVRRGNKKGPSSMLLLVSKLQQLELTLPSSDLLAPRSRSLSLSTLPSRFSTFRFFPAGAGTPGYFYLSPAMTGCTESPSILNDAIDMPPPISRCHSVSGQWSIGFSLMCLCGHAHHQLSQ